MYVGLCTRYLKLMTNGFGDLKIFYNDLKTFTHVFLVCFWYVHFASMVAFTESDLLTATSVPLHNSLRDNYYRTQWICMGCFCASVVRNMN